MHRGLYLVPCCYSFVYLRGKGLCDPQGKKSVFAIPTDKVETQDSSPLFLSTSGSSAESGVFSSRKKKSYRRKNAFPDRRLAVKNYFAATPLAVIKNVSRLSPQRTHVYPHLPAHPETKDSGASSEMERQHFELVFWVGLFKLTPAGHFCTFFFGGMQTQCNGFEGSFCGVLRTRSRTVTLLRALSWPRAAEVHAWCQAVMD